MSAAAQAWRTIGPFIESGVGDETCTLASRGDPRNAIPNARTMESALTAPTKARSAAAATRAARAGGDGAAPESKPE